MKTIIRFFIFSVLFNAFLVQANDESYLNRPNVVILMADDLGSGDVGFLGNETISTTQIDKLAKNGIILEQHLAPASVCTPSRAAFLTGRLPIRYGVAADDTRIRVTIWNSVPAGLPKEELSFANVLRDEGYRTGLVGKWHLGVNCESNDDHCFHPKTHGFDSWYGISLTNIRDCAEDGGSVLLPGAQWLIDDFSIASATLFIFLVFFHTIRLIHWDMATILLLGFIPQFISIIFQWGFHNVMLYSSCQLWRNESVIESPYSLDHMTQKLVREATDFMSSTPPEVPFLLMVNFLHVHTPLFSAPEFRGKSAHGKYGDNVLELDWAVGQIMDHLDKLGVRNDTIVYFSTDQAAHVEEIAQGTNERHGGHNIFRGGKGMGGFEGGIRVPALISYPRAGWTGGRVLEQATSMMDVYPTIIKQTNTPTQKIQFNRANQTNILDGKDMSSLLDGTRSIPEHEFMFHYCGNKLNAIRWSDQDGNIWKLHYFQPRWDPGTEGCASMLICACYGPYIQTYKVPLLYNLKTDVQEQKPKTPQNFEFYDQIKTEMEEGYRKWYGSFNETIPESMFTDWNVGVPRIWLQPLCDTFPYISC